MNAFGDLVLADNQRCRGAGKTDHIELDVRQKPDRSRNHGRHLHQVFRGDLDIAVEPRLVQRDVARGQRIAEFILDGLVGPKDEQAEIGAGADAVVGREGNVFLVEDKRVVGAAKRGVHGAVPFLMPIRIVDNRNDDFAKRVKSSVRILGTEKCRNFALSER
ncbi:hypothetical protein [Mesorhizobium sp. M0227]|uniref:hypothetical protein n=1 Tax=Mesorhizobium sp. M0227 TaxID=2956922 RepID=UPI00333AAC05